MEINSPLFLSQQFNRTAQMDMNNTTPLLKLSPQYVEDYTMCATLCENPQTYPTASLMPIVALWC